MQNFNLHTHTYRCGHAQGDEYDMAEEAIKKGFKFLGFSEHIGHKGWDNNNDRMPYAMMEDYFTDIEKVKEKYHGKLEILTGLEFEYFDGKEFYYNQVKKKCDYMIIGQHFNKVGGRDLYMDCQDVDALEYADLISKAIEKGYTKYVAHPSYIMYSKDRFTDGVAKAIEKIALTAKKYDAALECNIKGMSRGKRNYGEYQSYIYPHLKSWEIIREINPMIVIGYDAHSSQDLDRRDYEEKARKILDGANIVSSHEMFLFKNF